MGALENSIWEVLKDQDNWLDFSDEEKTALSKIQPTDYEAKIDGGGEYFMKANNRAT